MKTYQSGQALIVVLVIMAMGITVITAAIALVATTSLTASRFEIGDMALAAAESGVEESINQMLRDPKTETVNIPVGNTGVDENVVVDTNYNNGSGQFDITSTGTITTALNSSITRKVVVSGTYKDKLEISSWEEAD